jgi:hypothetical protein
MQITIDTSKPLTALDRELIKGLLSDDAAATGTIVTEPAEKPAPAKRPAAKPTPEPKVVEEPEPEEDDEDLLGVAEPVTQETVVNLVTAMVSGGQKAKVVAALKSIGAKKVTEIPTDKLQGFHALLTGA